LWELLALTRNPHRLFISSETKYINGRRDAVWKGQLNVEVQGP
jgi:hypothetical protein